MKRITAWSLALMLLFSLTACGGKESAPSQEPPKQTKPPKQTEQTQKAEPPEKEPESAPEVPALPKGDSFWMAYEYNIEGEKFPLTDEEWQADLTLWTDGTARFREVADGIAGLDPHALNMTWETAADGNVNFYCAYGGDEPYCTGVMTEEGFRLDRLGGSFCLKRSKMPQTAGELYSPAELSGVWLEVGYEVEGDQDATMPGKFTSLVIDVPWEADSDAHVMRVSSECGDYSGFVTGNTYYSRAATVLSEPIYQGCGNDEWSVRIGEESPLNQHGYPSGTDTYVTLLDSDTLLMQRYFSFDGGSIPGVSYQTYKRFVPALVDRRLEDEELAGSEWRCVSYIDAEGNDSKTPQGMTDFCLTLYPDRKFAYTTFAETGEADSGGGSWSLGEGNTLLLYNPNTGTDDWFAGALDIKKVVTTEYESDFYELHLWYDGGIMTLKHEEGSGGWTDYVDTMNDIEGRAFAAPENAMVVLYNQNYDDFSQYYTIPGYTVSDGANSQYVLVTAVLDGTYLWLEEDGFCAEDFGTLDAGESIIIWLDVPETGGPNLQIESKLGEYYYELNQSNLIFNENWNYITT
ncbi:MAG: hypothetical protein IJE22_04865 [Oscillibacter sp.]|nr:hypothetical protein [Oscillibacter sp.]